MSKTGAILIETSQVNKDIFENIVRAMLANGWSLNHDNGFSFMLNGSYDWECGELLDFEEVLEKVKNSIDNKLETCIDLTWDGTSYSVGVTYLDPQRVMFSVSGDQKKISLLDIIDYTWYFERLLPVFDVIDFTRIKCTYD